MALKMYTPFASNVAVTANQKPPPPTQPSLRPYIDGRNLWTTHIYELVYGLSVTQPMGIYIVARGCSIYTRHGNCTLDFRLRPRINVRGFRPTPITKRVSLPLSPRLACLGLAKNFALFNLRDHFTLHIHPPFLILISLLILPSFSWSMAAGFVYATV
jgi:hypothetical protein